MSDRGAISYPEEFDRIRAERDLYAALLALGDSDALETFLDRTLGFMVRVAAARQGYIRVESAGDSLPPIEAVAMAGCAPEDAERIAQAISRGIVREALDAGRAVHTAEAFSDPRFRDLPSVRASRIEAVFCVPLRGRALRGVVYLQGRLTPGPFPDDVRERIEQSVGQLVPFVDRALLRRLVSMGNDPTRQHRAVFDSGEMVGRTPALARTLREAAIVARTEVNVLITGETGTGKTALARALWRNSARAGRPFVELNCSAIPETLVEQELFGAEAGAHSTATRRLPGKLETAEGGVIFLDEIAEMPPAAQAKLLQFVEDKCYYPLGSSMPVRSDVRVIAATNVELDETVRDRRLRIDLRYRLETIPLRMPSLAQRRDDIPLIARSLCARHTSAAARSVRLSGAAELQLWAADWPGNVRQLSGCVLAGHMRCVADNAAEIEPRHLFPDAADGAARPPTWEEATLVFQRRLLTDTLVAIDWNKAEAARRLGLSRGHLYNLINAHGLREDDDEE